MIAKAGSIAESTQDEIVSLNDQNFVALLDLVRAGDEKAFQKLIDEFGLSLRSVIRNKLRSLPRRVWDTVDFEQTVWTCLYEQRERLGDFSTQKRFLAFLAGIAQHKISDVRRRRPLPIDSALPIEIARSRDPSPSSVIVANEFLDQLDSYNSVSAEIVQKLHAGWNRRSIAASLGIHERTVRRWLYQLKCKLLGK